MPVAAGEYHLRFAAMHDFTIDGSGATHVLEDGRRQGIEFTECRNVTVKNLTITRPVPAFTQGRIVALAADLTSDDVEIDRGYPANLDDPEAFPTKVFGYLFEPHARRVKAGAVSLYGDDHRRAERLRPGVFGFFWDHAYGPDVIPAAIGDHMAFRAHVRGDVHLSRCDSMTFDSVTIRNGGDRGSDPRAEEGLRAEAMSVPGRAWVRAVGRVG